MSVQTQMQNDRGETINMLHTTEPLDLPVLHFLTLTHFVCYISKVLTKEVLSLGENYPS
jgi:hypothetical protein